MIKRKCGYGKGLCRAYNEGLRRGQARQPLEPNPYKRDDYALSFKQGWTDATARIDRRDRSRTK